MAENIGDFSIGYIDKWDGTVGEINGYVFGLDHMRGFNPVHLALLEMRFNVSNRMFYKFEREGYFKATYLVYVLYKTNSSGNVLLEVLNPESEKNIVVDYLLDYYLCNYNLDVFDSIYNYPVIKSYFFFRLKSYIPRLVSEIDVQAMAKKVALKYENYTQRRVGSDTETDINRFSFSVYSDPYVINLLKIVLIKLSDKLMSGISKVLKREFMEFPNMRDNCINLSISLSTVEENDFRNSNAHSIAEADTLQIRNLFIKLYDKKRHQQALLDYCKILGGENRGIEIYNIERVITDRTNSVYLY